MATQAQITETYDFMDEIYRLTYGEHADVSAAMYNGDWSKTLEEAQAYLDHWEERWADTRIHGTTKRQVAAMFAEEKPHLAPLPPEPFRYYEYGSRVVHLDGHIELARGTAARSQKPL